MTGTDSYALHQTFRSARMRVSQHMHVFDQRGQNWKEETVTDLLLEECVPDVEFRAFNRSEEGKNGADWLWWWVDDRGEAFGMLVQAKRLKPSGTKIDFEYHQDGQPPGDQRRRLLRTASDYGVPAAYGLYLGTSEFRKGRYCVFGRSHADPCDYCEPATISIVAALLAAPVQPWDGDQPAFAIERSVPLEWVVDAYPGGTLDWLPGWDQMDEHLVAFLSTPQTGARRIAHRLFQPVGEEVNSTLQHLAHRFTTRLSAGPDQVFEALPTDEGPFGVSYFHEILRGLRKRPPTYVESILNGEEPDMPVGDIAGIAIVRIH